MDSGDSTMTYLTEFPLSVLQFYATAPYPCSYLPERMARSQVATPSHLIDSPVYCELVRAGFRRSGAFTYRPYCDHCRACVPVRILAEEFQPSRVQRRALEAARRSSRRRCSTSSTARSTTRCTCATSRSATPAAAWTRTAASSTATSCSRATCDSRLIEFRENGVLRMVSIVDELQDGLSSVYTFFDPDSSGASFGTYNILWQIELCRRLDLPYLYLGYWIAQSRKMAYKIQFQPMQGLIDGRWQAVQQRKA